MVQSAPAGGGGICVAVQGEDARGDLRQTRGDAKALRYPPEPGGVRLGLDAGLTFRVIWIETHMPLFHF